MTTFTKRSRVDAALRGEPADRPPVAAWGHFIPAERSAAPLAEAHLRFFETYDWDWLKVNPRATYYAEAWGARYDTGRYSGVLPALVETPLGGAADLARITRRDPDTPALAEQIELVRLIRPGLGGAHLLQTVFSPLSVLAFLVARPGDQAADVGLGSDFARLRGLLREDPAGAHRALCAIAHSLAGFAAANVAAGASGIFFAIVRLARQGVLSAKEYAEFGRPYDLQVLEAVRGAPFNLLHICGPRVFFDQVLDYPVHALNWAAQGQGNPSLAEARARTGRALVGGLDEHGALQHGAPAQVRAEARRALAEAGPAGVLLAPGCGLGLEVPEANLRALRQAVEPAAA